VSGELTQAILDALTDVDLPGRLPTRSADESLRIAGLDIGVYRCGALVLGSGAAGLRAAVELKRRGVDVLIATQNVFGGTSACSGSDKQTLHAAAGSGRGDNFDELAEALGAGGAMDEDVAYVEAVGSPRALASLQYFGLPLPQDRLGAILRYQTDHDEAGRATSCGPRTSRLMVQVLARETIRLEAPVLNGVIGVKILVEPGPPRRLAGLLAMRPKDRSPVDPLGLLIFLFDALVIAAGGPGELYRDSVYPKQCFGALGMALEAGIEAVNLTESQFGIGTSRDGFPWNLSGTYVQAMPHIFSLDRDGRERDFLGEYYRTTQELASNVFRKGYQWPFHSARMLDFGSSLVDLAIHRERLAGRRVFMDFNRDPAPAKGGEPFSLDRLDPDVRTYLGRSGALIESPIARLAKMNPLSIELYRRYKKDVARDPLEFAVNNQHMNGGLAVNVWGETNLGRCYAVGEAAGTHGVTRPGGAALISGQVFGARAAEHIAATSRRGKTPAPPRSLLESAVADILGELHPESPLSPRAIEREVQARMSDAAGFICRGEDVRAALAGARALNARIKAEGVACGRAYETARAVQWRQMAIASEAVLTALDFYIRGGGGSRGARAICDPKGELTPLAQKGALSDFRFLPERAADRDARVFVRYENGIFSCEIRPIRRRPHDDPAFFERDWPRFLSGAIYDRPDKAHE
jgi:succinate dehydrogenase / fumarate reductase flavoprotein subunit